ncbi:MAG: metallophosphoesterase [Polyangiaceae bacterium]
MIFAALAIVVLGALWITHRWVIESFPRLRAHRRALGVALAAVVALQIATGVVRVMTRGRYASALSTGIAVLIAAVVLTAAPLAALQMIAWACGRVKAKGHPEPRASAGEMSRRSLATAVGGIALYGATGSMLGWGIVRGRHAFELREVPVPIRGLPRALDGYVVVQVSDLHTGDLVRERELDEGLSLVRAARPDLVVVTGDLVDIDPEFARLAAHKLVSIPARDGVTAILGNHDHYAGAASVTRAMRAAGVDVLVNQGKVMRPRDGGGFALLGVDDLWGRRHGGGPRLDRAIAQVREDLPRVLLSHQPQTVDDWAGQVALQLSGHTHGGQINPGFVPLGLLLKYVAGAYAVGGTTLYVNRGFGTAGPPARVGAPPEVTRLVLVAS